MFFAINRLVFHRNSTTSGASEAPFVSLPAEDHGSRGAGEGGDKVIERSSSGTHESSSTVGLWNPEVGALQVGS